MGFFSQEARARRKARKEAKQDPFDAIERKLQLKRLDLEPGTDEYERISKELRDNTAMRAENRESKRRIAKADRGTLICRILSIIGAGAGIGSVIWAERQGMVFTGEKRSLMDSITRGIGNVFFKR